MNHRKEYHISVMYFLEFKCKKPDYKFDKRKEMKYRKEGKSCRNTQKGLSIYSFDSKLTESTKTRTWNKEKDGKSYDRIIHLNNVNLTDVDKGWIKKMNDGYHSFH